MAPQMDGMQAPNEGKEPRPLTNAGAEKVVRFNARPLMVDMSENNGITLAGSAAGVVRRTLSRVPGVKLDM